MGTCSARQQATVHLPGQCSSQTDGRPAQQSGYMLGRLPANTKSGSALLGCMGRGRLCFTIFDLGPEVCLAV